MASLAIRNFVLIEDAVLEFGPGLNVLTGETGAGKTLLTRALGLLMGERAEDGLVGNAADEAHIQAIFALDETEMAALPADVGALAGIEGPGEIIVTRRLGKQGRNRCYINDSAVTLATMATMVGVLLSFAGQHEYRRLLDPRYQLDVLDQWAGSHVVALAAEFATTYESAREMSRQLTEGLRTQETRLRELELLRFQVAELAEARMSADEEQALLAEQRTLSRAEDILRNAGTAADHLRGDGEEPDAGTLVARAGAQLAGLAGVDRSLDVIADSLAEVQHQITEIARELHGYVDGVSVNPERLQLVDARLRLYTDLARKYGGSTTAALARLGQARERLTALEHSEEDLSRLEEARAALAARALDLADALTAARQQAAPRLERAVALELAALGMVAAVLKVDVRPRIGWEGLRETGADIVEFLLVANPDHPARSLSRTASGGELSRVLLSIKCALAGAGGNETLVFDEIDAGIGGRTSVAVGLKLRELASLSQVIVVTHQAQVAALAAQHYMIEKATQSGATVTRLSLVTGDKVVEELCRMMGGRPDDPVAMAHARELRDRAAGGLLD